MKGYNQTLKEQLDINLPFKQIKFLRLKNEMDENELQSLIDQSQHFDCLNIVSYFNEQKAFIISKYLSNLKQLEGLSIEIPSQSIRSQYPIEVISQSFKCLSNLKFLSLIVAYNNQIDLKTSYIHFSQGFSSNQNLEILYLKFTQISELKQEGIQAISEGIKSLPKLVSLNLEILFSQNEDQILLYELLKDITYFTQLKELNFFIYKYQTTHQVIYCNNDMWDFSRLINLTILNLRISSVSNTFDLNFQSLSKSISKLPQIISLYIGLSCLELKASTITTFFDNILLSKNLSLLQVFILNRTFEKDEDITIGNQVKEESNIRNMYIGITNGNMKQPLPLKLGNQIERISDLRELTIELKNIYICQQSQQQFANWLKKCHKLEFLKILRNDSGEDNTLINQIGDKMQFCCNLQELNLSLGIGTAEDCYPFMLEGISHLKSLNKLELSGNISKLSTKQEDFKSCFEQLINLRSIKFSKFTELQNNENQSSVASIIKYLPQINELFITNPFSQLIMDFNLLRENFKYLQNLKNLIFDLFLIDKWEDAGQEDLNQNQLQDILIGIKYLSQLEYLKLLLVPKENDATFYYRELISNLKDLKNLRLVKLLDMYQDKNAMKMIFRVLIKRNKKLVSIQ